MFTFLLWCSPAGAVSHGHAPDRELAKSSVKIVKDGRPDGGADCSGVRVAPHYILTAGHCIDTNELNKSVVLWDGSLHGIESFRRHPQWSDATNENDFAILKIADDGPLGPFVALNDQPVRRGENLAVTGFGYSETGRDGVLGEIHAKVTHPHYLKTQFRANGGKNGICGGDSGGGAFLEINGAYILAGLNSWTADGDPDYDCDADIYFGDVAKVLPWIASITNYSIKVVSGSLLASPTMHPGAESREIAIALGKFSQ